MPLAGFAGKNTFSNSKVAKDTIRAGSGGKGMVKIGTNSSQSNVGMASNTKAATNPTTDSDDGKRN